MGFFMTKEILRGLVAVGVLASAGAANAAQDLTAITGSAAEIAAVGGAVFVVMVGIKLVKWIRRAL